ncbi:MAG TPA: phenylalanine--tRNA ligase subunit beta [Clostridiaceae bacterium]|jgi:phenylalanyl-tRNA synthetase beta chain|nr:phenylalanine--tRNA ligase subunit beta [Clostridiaceae bacterium]
MKVPVKWLSDYVKINVPIREYTEAMTLSGSKVEGVEDMGKDIEKVVVGKIVSMEKHPDADKLRICKVDTGSEVLQIVTGAPNVKEGDYIPLALVGAKLPGGEIKPTKLRGVESYGMMCSIDELSLTKDYLPDAPDYGVYVFNGTPELGMDVKEALDLDKVVEFEITSNRPDCLSIIGLARETVATLGETFKIPEVKVKEEAGGDINDLITIEIKNPELCYRYAARVVEDVKIEPSPAWMQRRLAAAGMRPINNIVDITNYVMLEYGQPMHAFDLDQVQGKKIIVRTPYEGETIRTLDGQDRNLDSDMLLICDANRPIGVAGVMGGENSEITDKTKTILLESATFNGSSIRKTGKKMGLRSEASIRFEKGLDIENAIPALNRCAELIELLGAGKIVKGIADCNCKPYEKRIFIFEPERINSFLGTEIETAEMVRIFKSLEFEVDEKKMTLIPPSFRNDIVELADLCEEIARFYGYNKIKPSLLSGKESMQGRKTYKQSMEDVIRNAMIGCGLNEAYTLSFASPKVFDTLNLAKDHYLRNAVVISNPLGEDFSLMRTTTLPDMLKSLSTNYNRNNPEAALFELSYVYIPIEGEELADERETLTIGLYGGTSDFYELKGIMEELLEAMGIKEYEFRPEKEETCFHPGRTAKFFVRSKNKEMVYGGILGEVHPEVAENYECPDRTYVAVADVGVLIDASTTEKQYRQLPKFPAITRDLAVVVDAELYVSQMLDTIKQKGGEYLEEVNIFDVYKGAQVPDGMKSVAFSLSFRALDKTLKDEDVNIAMEKILKRLEKEFGAQRR